MVAHQDRAVPVGQAVLAATKVAVIKAVVHAVAATKVAEVHAVAVTKVVAATKAVAATKVERGLVQTHHAQVTFRRLEPTALPNPRRTSKRKKGVEEARAHVSQANPKQRLLLVAERLPKLSPKREPREPVPQKSVGAEVGEPPGRGGKTGTTNDSHLSGAVRSFDTQNQS